MTNTISTNATRTVVSFIRDHDVTKCLTLLGPEKYNVVFDRIRYLIGLKSCSTYVDSHNYAKIKVDSADYLPLKKALVAHDTVKSVQIWRFFTQYSVLILIKSIFNKNYNN